MDGMKVQSAIQMAMSIAEAPVDDMQLCSGLTKASSCAFSHFACAEQKCALELDFSRDANRLDFDPADARKVVAIEDRSAAMDSLILCKFLRGVFADFAREGSELLRLVTGDVVDLDRAGRDICDLRKVFNVRAGWRRKNSR